MRTRSLPILVLISILSSTFFSTLNNNRQLPSVQAAPQSLTSTEQDLVALVNGSRAYDTDLQLENISSSHPAFRAAGSAGANDAANWIEQQFTNIGLNTSLEMFPFITWNLLNTPTLVIDNDGNPATLNDQLTIPSFESEHMSYPTLKSGVFAGVAVLPLPVANIHDEIGLNPINTTQWNEIDTTGKILLTGREVRWNTGWQQTFIDKITSQTPSAVVYTWWYSWMSFCPPFYASSGGKPLGTADYYWDLEIPVGFTDYQDGLTIRNTAETQPALSANVTIPSEIGYGPNYNVVGKIEGYEHPEKLIVISGHYDTVTDNGFLDNGAGTAGVIELARVFTQAAQQGLYRPSYTLIFVALTGEEMDLVGSIYYVAQHKDEMANLTAVINLDCIGSDDFYLTETDPSGDFDLDQLILACASDLGVTATVEPPGGSDQESFRIPYDVNLWCYYDWSIDPGISDAVPVHSSILLDSYPLFYADLWTRGTPGWIHTAYDNSTSTITLNWTKPENLENHIKVAALAVMRISPNVVIPPPPPPGVTVFVPDNYTTIQQAIDNVGDNSTIIVRAGTYYENVSVNKPLTLIGENSDSTVIDGNGATNAVLLTATCNITGFTIRNGGFGINAGVASLVPQFTGHGVAGNRIINNYYGGILLQGCANNTIADNLVTNNTLFGIHLWDSAYNEVRNNTVTENMHGITLYGNTFNNTLRNNNMTGNMYNFGLIMRGETSNYLSTNPSNPAFVNDIDTSNTVNGKPIYCLLNQKDIKIPSDAGYVWLNNCANVTVQGLNLSSNLQGVLILLSNGTTIADNTLVQNVHGIYVGSGSYNTTISNNSVENDFIGIYLGDVSAFTTMRNNTTSDCQMNFGVPPTLPLRLDSLDLTNDIDSSNTVNGKPIIYWADEHDKTVPSNAGYVMLINSTNIQLSGLSLSNNVQDIFLIASNNTLITNCTVNNAIYGIDAEPSHSFNGTYILIPSFNTTVENNTVSGNAVGIRLRGNNNTVLGNQILANALGVYFKGASYGAISQNIVNGQGALWLGGSGPDIAPFNYSYWRREFTIELLQMNVAGILVGGSSNMIFDNDAINNLVGVAIDIVSVPGSGNIIFNNNIYNNTQQQATSWMGNLWNSSYPAGGNYWGSSYTGTDFYSGPNQTQPGSDGIGDTAYSIFTGPRQRLSLDNYPLVAPLNFFPEQTSTGTSFDLKIVSNSTVSDLQFNEAARSITFNAEGEMGVGFCKVTIPDEIVNAFWQGELKIYVNGTSVAFTSWSGGNNTSLYFTYLQSTRTIVIVPEFPSSILLVLLVVSSFFVAAFKEKKTGNEMKKKAGNPDSAAHKQEQKPQNNCLTLGIG